MGLDATAVQAAPPDMIALTPEMPTETEIESDEDRSGFPFNVTDTRIVYTVFASRLYGLRANTRGSADTDIKLVISCMSLNTFQVYTILPSRTL